MDKSKHSRSIDISIVGEQAIELSWPCDISSVTFQELQGVYHELSIAYRDQILDIIPSYTKILIVFKSSEGIHQLLKELEVLISNTKQHEKGSVTKWIIPVCYHPDYAPDLEDFCHGKQLSLWDFVRLHTSVDYSIHFFGFLPGFCYLSGLDERLHLARKPRPISRVPKGSVAIGGAQTGIYPSESPGGWHLIGKTPISLFDIDKDPPVFAAIGDVIHFESITIDEFKRIASNIEDYQIRKEVVA
ncbi:5-oxoprolinase subunit PxpB [Winogradskyella aurantiaca]|uniref:5-oxoprolinase subunit PxpB n=1 Tax=Winogradskyella aurantiaca TaxID=2219558 RepID=UPI0018E50DFB|nr:5-oxoprolinase subunit PxpB [Winogradskyella aurantiaca]